VIRSADGGWEALAELDRVVGPLDISRIDMPAIAFVDAAIVSEDNEPVWYSGPVLAGEKITRDLDVICFGHEDSIGLAVDVDRHDHAFVLHMWRLLPRLFKVMPATLTENVDLNNGRS
jgi:hypothetical protein